MDEQGAEVPEEEGQGRWGDMHVQGGPSPSPPLIFPCTAPAFNHHNHINGQARGLRRTPPPPPSPACVQVIVAFGVLRSKGSRWCLSLGLHFVHYFSHPAGYGGRPVPAAAVAAGGWRQRVGLRRRGRHPLHRRRPPDHQRHRQPAGRRQNLATTPRRAPRWLLAVLDFSFHGRFCHSPLLPVVVPVMLLLVLCDLKATDYSIPISAWRELLSTTPATGTWKTQSTVPPMNKAETSIVRIPVRMMLDLLLEHLGLHKAI
ncbi:uncharacterized protein [Aegilops tauschii subsp. strangulata]